MILATLALFPLIQIQLGVPARADQVNETQLEFPATTPEAKGGKKVTSRPYISFAQGSDPFQIIQVNVDTDGNNSVGDAANEPSIAVSYADPDRMVIGWRQFDSVQSDFREAGYAWSDDGGATWHAGTLDNGVFRSDPVLDSDAAGNIYYYSLITSPWRCDMFVSSDGGQTWTGPLQGYGGDKQWMAIDRTGGSGHGFLYSACNTAGNQWSPRTFTRSVDGGQSWLFPIEIPNRPIWGTLAVAPNGDLYVVGRQSNSNTFRLAKSTNAKFAGQTPTFTVTSVNLGGVQRWFSGINPDGLLGQVWVAVDHSNGPSRGNVYVLCSVDPSGNDPLDVMFVRSTDGGQTFSAPVRVNDDSGNNWQWFGTMSVSPEGRIDVIWLDTRDEGSSRSRLYYSYSFDEGRTWAPNRPIGPTFDHSLGYPGGQQKMGDYFDMKSDSAGAHVAFAATYNGEQDVYYVNVVPGQPATVQSYELLHGAVEAGTVDDLKRSDNQYLRLASFPFSEVQEANLSSVRVRLSTLVQNPSELDVHVEVGSDQPISFGKIALYNWGTGQYDEFAPFSIGLKDVRFTRTRIPAGDYVGPNGEVDVRVKSVINVPFPLATFRTRVDKVQVVVR
ncbi:MAG: exo-alpha-sialidase [Armatimonadetes bacterium]|nr:MAG: exo-alpha-sialidase [Armatimonadota bacterium]